MCVCVCVCVCLLECVYKELHNTKKRAKNIIKVNN